MSAGHAAAPDEEARSREGAKTTNRLWGGLLFASGTAGLVFQTLWVKQLSTVVGVDVYAVTTGVSAFFGGLAAGSYVLGRSADRIQRPALLVAVLEVLIAALGITSTWLLASAAPVFIALGEVAGLAAWSVPFACVGVPAFFMGGSLPAVLRAASPSADFLSTAVGRFYASNTAGAIVGTLGTVFLLIPGLGLLGTAFVAGGVNLAVALGSFLLDRTLAPSEVAPRSARRPTADGARLAIVLYGLVGFIALGLEVVWTQAIVQFLSTRAYAFAVVLAVYLLGLVLGAAVYPRLANRIVSPWSLFSVLVTGAGATTLLAFGAAGSWLVDVQSLVGDGVSTLGGSRLLAMCARFAIAAGYLILPSTLLLGAAFPAAARLVAQADRVGGDVGAVAAVNTAGGIAGALAAGFVLIPALGTVHALVALGGGAVLVGSFAIHRSRARARRTWIPIGASTLLVLGFAAALPADKLGRILADQHSGELVFYEETSEGQVAVLRQQDRSSRAFHRLYIQGVSNSGDTLPSQRYMRLQALLPLLIHRGEPKSALVIGFGTGITAGATSAYPLESRTAVELVPAVVRAAPLFAGNLGAGSDADLRILHRDGRHHLLATSDVYDLITLEPPPPSASRVVNLYSKEFYAIARERLAPNGLLAQWWPLATQNDEDSRSLMRSLLDAFPYVNVWTTEMHEMVVIASARPIEIDLQRIAPRFALPEVRYALAEVGIQSTTALLSTYVMGREGLSAYVDEAPPVTDDRPHVEYGSWVRPDEIERVLPVLMDLAEAPPIRGVPEPVLQRIEERREHLFDFYRGVLAAYEGDESGWRERMERAVERDGRNRYMRWFLPPE